MIRYVTELSSSSSNLTIFVALYRTHLTLHHSDERVLLYNLPKNGVIPITVQILNDLELI